MQQAERKLHSAGFIKCTSTALLLILYSSKCAYFSQSQMKVNLILTQLHFFTEYFLTECIQPGIALYQVKTTIQSDIDAYTHGKTFQN